MKKEKNKGPLEGVLQGIIKGLDKKGRLTQEEMAAVWRSAVGKKVASHTKPVSLRRARLIVNVDGSPWLYELAVKKKEILKKLSEKMRSGEVKDIRLRIGEV